MPMDMLCSSGISWNCNTLFLQICVILMSSATVPWCDGTLPFVFGNSPGHGWVNSWQGNGGKTNETKLRISFKQHVVPKIACTLSLYVWCFSLSLHIWPLLSSQLTAQKRKGLGSIHSSRTLISMGTFISVFHKQFPDALGWSRL